MELNVKALSPKIGTEIPAPFYASAGAAAMDLHACVDQAVTIPAGGRAVIPTGIAIALPSAGYVALVFARSGLGIKHGIALSPFFRRASAPFCQRIGATSDLVPRSLLCLHISAL